MQVSLIFTFIFALVMIGLIIAFAVGPIADMFGFSAQAQVYRAIKDIEKLTQEVYQGSLGMSRAYQLTIPQETKICFIDPDNPAKQMYTTAEKWKWWDPEYLDTIRKEFIENEQSEYFGSNIWYWHPKTGSLGEGYKIARLRPDQNFCAIGGKELFLQNKGPIVQISV